MWCIHGCVNLQSINKQKPSMFAIELYVGMIPAVVSNTASLRSCLGEYGATESNESFQKTNCHPSI